MNAHPVASKTISQSVRNLFPEDSGGSPSIGEFPLPNPEATFKQEAKIYTPILREGVPHKHLEGSLCICIFLPFSFFFHWKPAFWYTQTSFLPVDALEFSELKTPLVYTFSVRLKNFGWSS